MKLKYFVFISIILTAVVALVFFRSKDGRSEIEIARHRDLGYTVAATGKVEGWKEADIGVKSPGRIEFIEEEGKSIKKGGILVSLDKGELNARLEEASHTLMQTEIDIKRYNELYEKGYMPKRDFDLSNTAFKRANANVKIIQELLNDTVQRAPFDCVVVKKYKEVGETVGMSISYEPVLKIADLEKLKIRAEIEESDIGKISAGLDAEITCDAYKGEVFKGRVINVGYAAGKKKLKSEDPKEMVDVKVIESEIEVQPTAKLKVGMTVEVKIKSLLKSNVVSITKKTLITDNGENYVRVSDGNNIKRIKIKTGTSDDVYTEILGGLKEGDKVIREPMQ